MLPGQVHLIKALLNYQDEAASRRAHQGGWFKGDAHVLDILTGEKDSDSYQPLHLAAVHKKLEVCLAKHDRELQRALCRPE